MYYQVFLILSHKFHKDWNNIYKITHITQTDYWPTLYFLLKNIHYRFISKIDFKFSSVWLETKYNCLNAHLKCHRTAFDTQWTRQVIP